MESTSALPPDPDTTLEQLQQLELQPLLTARSAPLWQPVAIGATFTVAFALTALDSVIASLVAPVAIGIGIALAVSYSRHGGVDFGWGKGLPSVMARKLRLVSLLTALVAVPLVIASGLTKSLPLALVAGAVFTLGVVGSAMWFRTLADQYLAERHAASRSAAA